MKIHLDSIYRIISFLIIFVSALISIINILYEICVFQYSFRHEMHGK